MSVEVLRLCAFLFTLFGGVGSLYINNRFAGGFMLFASGMNLAALLEG